MAMYSVYDNILVKLESVFLKVEMEVDREITGLIAEQQKLTYQLNDLRGKIDVLNSLKRSYDLYCDNPAELNKLSRSLFKVISDKQILLRFLQEKEVLLNGHLLPLPDVKIPTIIELNKEFRLRKKLQEIELLSSFLVEDPGFERFSPELEKANEIFDLSIESGASDKLEAAIELFQNYFEKIINLYDLDTQLVEEFKELQAQILLQANNALPFIPDNVSSHENLQKTYKATQAERLSLECEVNNLLYQFAMLGNGKKSIISETKATEGELESILFKEYALKQKIQELRSYKSELNKEKNDFLRDPTLDGYTEAVKRLEFVESRFKKLMFHLNSDGQQLINRFFSTNRQREGHRKQSEERTTYNKILFQVLHNNHISSADKMVILRLSKPSKLLNTNTGKFFYQRTAKTRSLQRVENSFRRVNSQEIH